MLRACIHTSNFTQPRREKEMDVCTESVYETSICRDELKVVIITNDYIGVPAEQGFWWPPSWVPSTSSVAFALASILQKARVTGLTRSAVGLEALNLWCPKSCLNH